MLVFNESNLHKIVHVKVSVKYIRNIASSCLPDVYDSAKNCGYEIIPEGL